MRLLLYAYKYAASKGWKAEDRVIARGQGVDDIVQDAIISFLPSEGGTPDEKRLRWNPGETPDPMDYLRSFVNSRIDSLWRSYERKNVSREVDPEAHQAADDPVSEVIEMDLRLWRARGRDLLLALIIDDDLLVRTYDLLEHEEVHKPSELANRLGVSLDEAKNALRRFWRAWAKVAEQLRGELVEPKEVKDA